MSVTALLLVALLATELPLLILALRNRGPGWRRLLFVVPLALAFGLRAARALGTHEVLDWDETYYASLAVTAASGNGLYPYIYGFGPMPIMGGVGYAAELYVAAVKLFGPTILALRFVSLLASAAALLGIWTVVRKWYGGGAAWIAVALTASLQLFALTNTVRMDSLTFAWVSWGLVAIAWAFERWPGTWPHLLAGLIFGLGLQAHIDTVVTAAACGLLYLLHSAREWRTGEQRWTAARPTLLYAAGLFTGAVVYVAANILPDLAAYYFMTVRVRVDATQWYSGGTSSLAGSFLNPSIILAKETQRYRQLTAAMPALELALLATGIGAAAFRRNAADRLLLVLVPTVLVGAAVLLNNASPLYFTHILPALVVPLAPLFTHGLRRQAPSDLAAIPPAGLTAAVLALAALCALSSGRTVHAMRGTTDLAPAARIQSARSAIGPRCIVAGDGGLFVPYFMDRPYFISYRPTEVAYALLYYDTHDELAYWRIKRPDVVFATQPLRPALAAYVSEQRLERKQDGLWMNPAGCRPGP